MNCHHHLWFVQLCVYSFLETNKLEANKLIISFSLQPSLETGSHSELVALQTFRLVTAGKNTGELNNSQDSLVPGGSHWQWQWISTIAGMLQSLIHLWDSCYDSWIVLKKQQASIKSKWQLSLIIGLNLCCHVLLRQLIPVQITTHF